MYVCMYVCVYVCVCVCDCVCTRVLQQQQTFPLQLQARSSHFITEGIRLITKTQTNHWLGNTRPIHPFTQTFAALRSVVGIPGWAILAFHGSKRVGAFARADAVAVVCRALVHV